MVHIPNGELERLFNCIKPELPRMQRYLKQQMQKTLVEGRLLIGELFKKVDKDGAIRDTGWERVADHDPMFAAMLNDGRSGNHTPRNSAGRLARAKRKMARRSNGPY